MIAAIIEIVLQSLKHRKKIEDTTPNDLSLSFGLFIIRELFSHQKLNANAGYDNCDYDVCWLKN